MAKELLQYFDAGIAEVPVAQRYEEVVLQASKYDQPLLNLIIFEVLLKTGFKYFDVCPVKVLKVAIYYMFFKGLCYVERIPLVGCPIRTIFFSVCPRNVNLFFCAREGLHFKGG
jgi:hypothetical protein